MNTRRHLSTVYTLLKRSATALARARQPKLANTNVNEAWARLITAANRRQLLAPPAAQLQARRGQSRLTRLDAAIQRWLAQEKSPYSYSWTVALSALGAQRAHETWGDPADFGALNAMLDRHIDGDGNWLTPINRVDSAMKGYSLLYVAERSSAVRYWRAADVLATTLSAHLPRAADGSLVYDPSTGAILVDTLAMICPFLARYAAVRQNDAARHLSTQQLLNFIASGVDAETHLPYHGYYAGGAKRLGLHAWGRGVGWYVMGIVDTLAELTPEHPSYEELHRALSLAVDSLVAHQRADGHWNWGILHRDDTLDSSTTALVGYGFMRGRILGLLSAGLQPSIVAALHALARVTRSDGQLDLGLGECRGLGKYPQVYGPQPWLQGAATAFASLYLKYYGENEP